MHRIKLVVPVINSSISILVFCHSCVSCIASNRNVSCMGTEMPIRLISNTNKFTWFDSFLFVANYNQQIAKWLRGYSPHCTLFVNDPQVSSSLWYLNFHVLVQVMPNVLSLLLHFALIGDFFQRHFNTNQFQHSTWCIQLLRCQFYCHQYLPRLSNDFISCEFIWLSCSSSLHLVCSTQIMAVSSSSHFQFALCCGDFSTINFAAVVGLSAPS